jgi:tetratricopeptide (TPR) repeat protein
VQPIIVFKSLGSLLLVWSLVFAPATVFAQSQADKTFAQEAFKQGQIQYNLGRFEKALEHFSKAYETMPHGAFLFNIGQCHRHLNDHEKAVFFFEGYLRALPTAPNRQEVEDLIAEHNAKFMIEKSRPKKAKSIKAKSKEATANAPQAEKAPTVNTVSKTDMIIAPTTESWVIWTVIGAVGVIGTAIGLIAVLNRADNNDSSGSTLGEDSTLGDYDLSE